eukprot:TRINITY_DN23_c0_g1_i1.p1 TRINITY_DN23_c0_g1~~TRINITY_DN23_c0_g1_i1.p1  ORF type:complete len:140 (-),score=24.46 TRINITY_DN23_c0_g1_i1:23-442(-)
MASGSSTGFLKPGKVVIVLRGRYAGRKAVIVENFATPTKDRPYAHCLIAGIEKYPMKVTRTMGKRKIAKRSKVTSFLKVINQNHLMPTRYGLDIPLAGILSEVNITDPAQKKKGESSVRRAFEERYNTCLLYTSDAADE